MSILIGEHDFWTFKNAEGINPALLEINFIEIPKDHKENIERTEYFTEDQIDEYLLKHDPILLIDLLSYYDVDGVKELSLDMQKVEDHIIFLDRQAPQFLTDLIKFINPK